MLSILPAFTAGLILHKGVLVMHTTSFCMMSRNMKLTTTMADCEFNYRLCLLARQFSSNRVDDDLF